mmetsp:Transcript_29848/g.48111  ORF Transcript_29848/g.48111 Transcript_29848/m.48111 type:complete len:84 (+) Transcript_29848:2498-2749(+)
MYYPWYPSLDRHRGLQIALFCLGHYLHLSDEAGESGRNESISVESKSHDQKEITTDAPVEPPSSSRSLWRAIADLEVGHENVP